MKFRSSDKISEASIASFELKFNIQLPVVYKKFMGNQNGGILDGYLYTNDNMEVYSISFFIGIDSKNPIINISEDYEELRTYLPKNYFPVAYDGGGNYYLIKLGVNKAPVYFWDHNLQTVGTKAIGLERIAPSFNHFVDNIKLDTQEIKEVTVTRKNGMFTLS